MVSMVYGINLNYTLPVTGGAVGVSGGSAGLWGVGGADSPTHSSAGAETTAMGEVWACVSAELCHYFSLPAEPSTFGGGSSSVTV